jgi:hypothetical protein
MNEKNKPSTVKQKGFDRVLIDTGTFFRAIKARITKTRLK